MWCMSLSKPWMLALMHSTDSVSNVKCHVLHQHGMGVHGFGAGQNVKWLIRPKQKLKKPFEGLFTFSPFATTASTWTTTTARWWRWMSSIYLLIIPLIWESFSCCCCLSRRSLSSSRFWYCRRIWLVCCSWFSSLLSYSSSFLWDITRRSFSEWISSSYSLTWSGGEAPGGGEQENTLREPGKAQISLTFGTYWA